MRLVIVESPFAGPTPEAIARHEAYACAALADCFARGEAPFASHAIYPRRGILRDEDPAQRELGIQAGLAWAERADATVVYADLGYSPGMLVGLEHARTRRRPVEVRMLGGWACPCTACQFRSRVRPS